MSRGVQDDVSLELIQLFLRWLHVTNEINKTGIIGIQDLKLMIQRMFDTVVVESGVIQYGDCIRNSSLYSLQRLLLTFISSYNDYWATIEAIYWGCNRRESVWWNQWCFVNYYDIVFVQCKVYFLRCFFIDGNVKCCMDSFSIQVSSEDGSVCLS